MACQVIDWAMQVHGGGGVSRRLPARLRLCARAHAALRRRPGRSAPQPDRQDRARPPRRAAAGADAAAPGSRRVKLETRARKCGADPVSPGGIRLRADFAARLRRRSADRGLAARCGNCAAEDAQFVYADSRTRQLRIITLVSIYDPSTAADGQVHFTGLLKHIERRLHLSPIFRQQLLRVPLELDHPYWIEDERFDLEYHVRHVALPKPGDWRQFCIQASRIHARPLDHGTAALGAVPGRGVGCLSRSAEEQFCDPRQDPPRSDRRERRRRDHDSPARHDAATARVRTARAVVP